MVQDKDIAWQAGLSSWMVDGRVVNGCNPSRSASSWRTSTPAATPTRSLSITLHSGCVRRLVAKYKIPRRQLVRHLDIAPRRKTDPAGFPWERFVDEVYGPPPAPTPAAPPTAPGDYADTRAAPRAAAAPQVAGRPGLPRGRLVTRRRLAAAEGGDLEGHRDADQGITPPPTGDGQGEDEQQRAVTIAGQLLILEAYGRDLFYASPDHLDQVQRLSETPAGPLRDALLQALFRNADPAKGFRSDQAFHQFYLNHMTEIGVPIGPDHVLPGGGKSCQHFALDTLIWTGSAVARLSDLTRDMYGADPHQQWEKDLRMVVLNDLYNARTGRNFDPTALFCNYAIRNGMGAPMGKAEIQILEGHRLVAMPYALDVLYCQIPGDGDWRTVVIGELPPGVLGDEEDGMAKLSTLLAQADPDDETPAVLGEEQSVEDVLPQQIYTGGLFGVETQEPQISDISASIGAGGDRRGTAIDVLVVYPTIGPSSDDISEAARPGATVWHYYVDRIGAILQLVGEAQAAHAAGDASWQGQGNIDVRSLAVAVESAAGSVLSEEQATALNWLLRDLMSRHNLVRGQIIQGLDLGVSAAIEGWDRVLN